MKVNLKITVREGLARAGRVGISDSTFRIPGLAQRRRGRRLPTCDFHYENGALMLGNVKIELPNNDRIVDGYKMGIGYVRLRDEPGDIEGFTSYIKKGGFSLIFIEIPANLNTVLIDQIITSRLSLGMDKLIIGIYNGHPSTLPLLYSVGCDIIATDGAFRYSQRGLYLTMYSSIGKERLEETPCSCPYCLSESGDVYGHNLYVYRMVFARVRNAILNGELWNLAEETARAYSNSLECLFHIFDRYADILEKFEPRTRRGPVFYYGVETWFRPDLRRAYGRLKEIKDGKSFNTPLGKVPIGLRFVYPFSHMEFPLFREPRAKPTVREQVRSTLEFQYGVDVSTCLRNIRGSKSKRTGMLRNVLDGDIVIGMIRPEDGFFIPNMEGARRLSRVLNGRFTVKVRDKFVKNVLEGLSVYTDHVLELDDQIRPSDEVIIVDPAGEVIGTGKTLLSACEINYFDHHPFVKVRHHK